MAHTESHGAGAHGGPKLNHETTDIPLGGTTRAALLSLTFSAIVFAVMYGVWGLLVSYAQKDDPGLPPMAVEDFGARVPKTPRLQTTQQADLATMRDGQRTRATSYGWVDQATGVAHMPVDQAMKLVVSRAAEFSDPSLAAPSTPPGVPATTDPGPAPAAPATPPPSGTGQGNSSATPPSQTPPHE